MNETITPQQFIQEQLNNITIQQENINPTNNILRYSLQAPEVSKNIYKVNPVILTNVQSFLPIQLINKNLNKQIQDLDTQILFIIQLKDKNQNDFCQAKQQSNTKISFQVKLKQVFNRDNMKNYLQSFKQLKIQDIMKKQIKQIFPCQNITNQKKYFDSWSFRLFPNDKSLNQIFSDLPAAIIPLFINDIFAYNKYKKSIKCQYIIGSSGYTELKKAKVQTQIYFNWGQSNVKFTFLKKYSILKSSMAEQMNKSQIIQLKQTCILRPKQILIVPFGFEYEILNDNNNQNSKQQNFCLFSWTLLPRNYIFQTLNCQSNFPQLLQNNDYSLTRILIDFFFHEYSSQDWKQHLISQFRQNNQNQEFIMYSIANSLASEFNKEHCIIEKLFIDQSQIINGRLPKYIDKCQNCQNKFIINYFADHDKKIQCAQCINKSLKITHVYQRMQKRVFEEGCNFLIKIKDYENQIKKQNLNISKILKHSCFFQYQDFCDGQFIGSYNNIHCKNIQNQDRRLLQRKQQLIKNSIISIKKCMNIKTANQIFLSYSNKKFKNQKEKQNLKQILERSLYFINAKDQKKIISQLLPNYQQDNLKIFAIQLCASINI